jgi:L-malate glycosyltransferase
MNILHITTYLQGGAGRIIADLASSQALAGHKVIVAASGKAEQDYGNYSQWLDQLASVGADLILVDSTFKRDVSLNVAAFRQIADEVDCASLSLIHTHAAIPSLVALLLRSRAKRAIPILQTMHGWGVRKSRDQAATDISLMSQLDRVIATSESSKRLLSDLGLEPALITVIPNGVAPPPQSTDASSTSMLAQWRSRGLKVLVCIGTVGPRKNQRLLVESMAHAQAPRNIACAVIGEGEEVPALQAMAQESGIGDRVYFFGYQRETAQFLASADWLILPSNDEGLPLSILEAYRVCVPVLGSDIPEIAEIVLPQQTGILFQAGNSDSLVQALVKIAQMPESERKRMGIASKQLWQERYSFERMFDQYAQIYRELLSHASSSNNAGFLS